MSFRTQTRSQDEWLALLEQQQQLHELEVERWKDILSSSVHLMEQVRSWRRARVVTKLSFHWVCLDSALESQYRLEIYCMVIIST